MNDGDLQLKLSQQVRCQRDTERADESTSDNPVWRVTVRRVVAFIIDGLALMATGVLITMIGGRYLFFIGDNGWWIGIVISAIYFGMLDSSIGGGRTLGKRFTGIEVVKIDGTHIGFLDALLRYSPFAIIATVILFTNQANGYSPIVVLLELIGTLTFLAIAIFGMVHPQRRSLHDLLLDTMVIKNDKVFTFKSASIKTPLIIFLVAGFLIGGAEIAMKGYLIYSADGRKLHTLYERLAVRKDIENPQISLFYTLGKDFKIRKAVVIRAYVPGGIRTVVRYKDTKRIADNIKMFISGIHLAPGDTKDIMIELRSGYTIGIGGEMTRFHFKYPYSRHVIPVIRGPKKPIIRRFQGGSKKKYEVEKKKTVEKK
ncbi:MAG: RDD family protein [Deltaproteobacteria bacterium]|jgi:uncharacterized RDD family membrane protein YckC|nr:RDD family protein [Deltaproteobacteria bacterium]